MTTPFKGADRAALKLEVLEVCRGLIALGLIPAEARLAAAIPRAGATTLGKMRNELRDEGRIAWESAVRVDPEGPLGCERRRAEIDAEKALLAVRRSRPPRVYRHPTIGVGGRRVRA